MNKSGYDEICESYTEARNEYSKYKDTCLGFLDGLILNFINYIGAPHSHFRFTPFYDNVNKSNPDEMYSVRQAAILGDDAYWNIGVLLKINDLAREHTESYMLIAIKVKYADNNYDLQFNSGGKYFTFKVTENTVEKCKHFFDSIKNTIINTFDNHLQRVLDNEKEIRRIGF